VSRNLKQGDTLLGFKPEDLLRILRTLISSHPATYIARNIVPQQVAPKMNVGTRATAPIEDFDEAVLGVNDIGLGSTGCVIAAELEAGVAAGLATELENEFALVDEVVEGFDDAGT
jgi:hypothetical protein